MSAYKHIINAVLGIIITIVIGIMGFQYFEGLKFFDALWITAVSLLTVGYGDVVPKTDAGKIFTLFIIPIGVGFVTYGLGAVVALIIEGELSKTVWRKKMQRSIQKLTKHVIICGLGRVGQQVMLQLQQEGVPIVVVDRDVDKLRNNVAEHDGKIIYVEGDATDDKALYAAGIERACGLIAALPEDADNVFIALTAKGINKDIQVVARAEKTGVEEKLYRAGADKVINPSNIAGRRMAMSILKPISVDYVDTILHAQQEDFGIEEIVILPESRLINKNLVESKIRENYGVIVVAIKRDETIISNPQPGEVFLANDIIIVFGTRTQLAKFEIASKA